MFDWAFPVNASFDNLKKNDVLCRKYPVLQFD